MFYILFLKLRHTFRWENPYEIETISNLFLNIKKNSILY